MDAVDLIIPAVVAAPVSYVTALITSRFQVWTAKEQELRALLDRGTVVLPSVRLKLGWARSDLEQPEIDAATRRRRLEELDAARVAAEEVADLLLTHAGERALVNVRFCEALGPARLARDVLVDAADGKLDDADEARSRVDSCREEFDSCHRVYLEAASDYIARRGDNRRKRGRR